MSIKDRVRKYLEEVAPRGAGSTEIGRALGYEYPEASASVNEPVKALVKEGWAERFDKPAKYRKKV